ncbi:hypothetical protein BpHYR1_036089 [Brachionus plicatilis]|uniref:Apple domain-containing protein n=1 Tax=Brachionus plicatilis TaxID=10195 RepID=A0A3M7RDY0_BRAPC|nr:hypothetical protein BpHYR1_036089 [Brachionus plicatilis]
MVFTYLLTLTILLGFVKYTKAFENRFSIVKINNSKSFDLAQNFRANFTIKIFNDISNLKCSSQCSLESKCLYFSYSILKSSQVCSLFSSDKIDSSSVIFDLNSKIYRKILTENVAFSTTVPMDYTCVNQDCTCNDALSFYSTIQNKCIKCRNGWLPYKNVCYQGFAMARKWTDYVTYCNSLNSTLLMPIDADKFNYFAFVGRNLSLINSIIRLWVSAKYDTQSIYEWTNGVSLNKSYINSIFYDSTSIGYFAYMVGNQVPQLGLSLATSTSNGVCEYFE